MSQLSTILTFCLKGRGKSLFEVLLAWCLTFVSHAQVAQGHHEQQDHSRYITWPEAPMTAKPGVIWWWPGSAVDEQNLIQELDALKDAGFGGANIVPIYGVKGQEQRFLEYLSPQWIEMVNFTVREAAQREMWIDMTTGTGWRFGGPWITKEHAAKQAKWVVPENQDPVTQGKLVVESRQDGVKRAAPGGKGLTINPFSQASLKIFLNQVDEGFAEKGIVRARAQYHDSFEYKGNWSPELFDQFEKYRGYDLNDYLPQLFGHGDSEIVARVKCDYRAAMAQMHLNWIRSWDNWASMHGMQTRNQAHGAPGNLLDLYAAADIAEIETFGAEVLPIPGIRFEQAQMRSDHVQPWIQRLASSAAHVASRTHEGRLSPSGHNLISAETGTWLRNHFQVSMAMLKPELDELFLNGVNHVLYHGTCYSPNDATWPGWLFYAAWQCNDRNPIWQHLPAMNEYVTRVQTVLQGGESDQDVLLYWPVYDLWQNTSGMLKPLTVHKTGWYDNAPAAKTASDLETLGLTYDWVSDQLLDQILDDQAMHYRAIVIPPTQVMPLRTAKRLMALQDLGIPVYFVRQIPQTVPGLYEYQDRESQMKSILAKANVIDALNPQLLPEQLLKTSLSDLPQNGIRYIRRRYPMGEAYFVANLTGEPIKAWCRIPVGRLNRLSTQQTVESNRQSGLARAVWLDPMDGQIGDALMKETKVWFSLDPGESRILWMDQTQKGSGRNWYDFEDQNLQISETFSDANSLKHKIQLDGAWKLDLITNKNNASEFETVSMQTLKPWSDLGSAYEAFSGAGRYVTTFEIDHQHVISDQTRWVLSLGDVRESARVWINGKEAGTLWAVPFEIDATDYLKTGVNTLEIEVVSLGANQIRELDQREVQWRIFYDINFVNHLYKKFDASKWPVTPSGLIGPVELKAFQLMAE